MSKEIATIDHSVPTIESYATNIQQKLQMCKLLRESGFAPAGFKNDGSVLAAILYGQELGFSPIQSLHSIDVIQGKPTVNAQGLKAMILAAGGVIKEIEWTDKVCTLEGYRQGNKQSASFTIQEAAQMGLASKDNWRKMPKLMLYARAVSILSRNQWADKIKGLYSKEEMQDSVIVQNVQEVQPETSTAEVVSTNDTQPESDVWTGEQIMDFGKHKGKAWKDVSGDYIEWLFQNTKGEKAVNAGLELARRDEVQQGIFKDINEQAEQALNIDTDDIPAEFIK